MAAVLEFRSDGLRRSGGPRRPAASAGQSECQIVIFPGVRRERHACETSMPAAKEGADRQDGAR